jgi:hypothetical protein
MERRHLYGEERMCFAVAFLWWRGPDTRSLVNFAFSIFVVTTVSMKESLSV